MKVEPQQLAIRSRLTKTAVFSATLASLFIISGIFSFVTPAQAAVPKLLNFQGKLTQVSNGTNVANGTYAFQFKLYDAVTSGNLLWTETYDQPSGSCAKLSVTAGVFNAKLGSCNALTGVDFTGGAVYLSVNFAPTGTSYDGEMSPRKQITASAFALVANGVAGDGKIDIANTGSNQATIGYDGSNKLTVNVSSAGFTTLTVAGSGAGLNVAGGNLGVGASTISAKLHSLATTEQLRLGYDAANYAAFTTSSGGNLTVAPSGGTVNITGITTISSILQVGSATATTYSRLGTGATNHSLNAADDLLVSDDFEVDGDAFVDGTLTLANALAVGSGGTGATSSQGAINAISQLTTNGDLLYHNGTNSTRLARGADGECLTSTTTTIQWGSCGAGGGGTLQQAYGTDADGSNATISLTAADDGLVFTNPSSNGTDEASFLLQLSQANTTANVLALDIIQSSNAANGANLTANSIDTETGLAIVSNGLTSGKGLTINSSSTAFTGSLAEITLSGSNAVNLGSLLKLANTGTASGSIGLYIDHRATGTGNLAVRIDDESGDTSPFIIDGDGRVGIGTSSITGSTERLLQIGSPTNRGNTVSYGDIVTKGVSDITGLTGIKDIFLYDTTADSDGGRWIDWATTDQLSWYTETLDDAPNDPCNIATDDRCYATAFPRKAILVVTTDALYIFDAATNDMWMKFSQNASGYALGVDSGNDPSSVTALNGVIYVGTNGASQGGLYVIDFVNDRLWNIDGTDRSAANVGISGRNAAVTYGSDNTTAFDLSVTGTAAEWEDINDVSAVYITGSSTAIATGATVNTSPGSGQTFVALATDSGITVLNMTAQKVLQYSDVTADDYTAVALTRRGRMYALNTTSDQAEMWINFDTDKASEVNGTFDARYDETVGPALWTSAPNIIAGAPDALEVIERGSLAEDTSDILYVGHSLGLTEIHTHSTVTNGWSKFFDTTRQTMFMPNAIDMALMMDDSSGTLANDISFNNTDMSIKGTPTLGVSGVRGKAIQFDNTDDFLCSDADQNGTCDVDASFNMTTVGWTLSMWFKHSTTAPASGADTLFEKCVTATPAQATGCVIVYMTTTGTIVSANDTDATWTRPDVGAASYNITATSSLTYNDNQWHHLIVTRTNANDVDTFIDGNPLNLSTATGGTTTFDGSQIVTIGASCSTTAGANCTTLTNYWDGVIDDVTFSSGTTTVSTLSALQARRLYNDARPLVAKKVVTVADATTATSTTIGDSGEAWIPNEFAGMFVTLTGGVGAGQTRRIISNTTTTLTVSPAFQTTPDTTTDFEVDPEALYGSSNAVYAIGITAENPLGQARQMCIGTNDGSDGGGVTCYNHQAGPNLIADLFHGDSEQIDDFGVEWTGTNYDDIRSIDLSGRALVVGSEAHIYAETSDVRLGQGLDYVANQLFNIRAEIINDGITLTGSSAIEVGFTGGADLAEYYYSNDALEAGEVVVIDTKGDGDDVLRSTKRYSSGLFGVVSTEPGLILGLKNSNGHPIALTGRVRVKFSLENGPVKAGDYLTSASVPGFAMRATGAGPTIGKALTDSQPLEAMADCPAINPDFSPTQQKCGYVIVFVEHGSYSGMPVDQLMREMQLSIGTDGTIIEQSLDGLIENGNNILTDTGLSGGSSDLTTDEKILVFLKYVKSKKESAGEGVSAQIFTDRVSAAFEVITPQVTTAGLKVETIGKLGATIDVLGDPVFFGRPYLNNDTAGFALIKKGTSFVEVKFDKEYLDQPVVTAGITAELDIETLKSGDVEKIKTLQSQQEQLAQELFIQGVQVMVIKKSVQGFTIIINKPAPQDITFSWIALAVKNPKLFGKQEPVAEPVDEITPQSGSVLGDSNGAKPSPLTDINPDSGTGDNTEQPTDSGQIDPVEDIQPEPLPPVVEQPPVTTPVEIPAIAE